MFRSPQYRTASLIAAFIALTVAAQPTCAFAQTDPDSKLIPAGQAASSAGSLITYTETGDGLTISLSGDASEEMRRRLRTASGPRVRGDGGDFDQLPLIRVGDVLLPGQLIPVVIDDTAVMHRSAAKSAPSSQGTASLSALIAEMQSNTIESEPWAGVDEIKSADIPLARTLDGEPLADLTRAPDRTLPKAPVTVLHEGYMRSAHLAVLAVTPIFEQNGETRFAKSIGMTIPGARVLTDTTVLLSAFDIDNNNVRTSVANALAATSAPPLNYAAGGQAWKITVANVGIQQVTASALPGLSLPVSVASIHVRYKGQETALQILDADADGQFETGDALRFYAGTPGDRWNATDTYWLTIENGGTPVRMSAQSTTGSSGSPSTTAIERGTYINNKFYDAALNGLDGDHWFGAELNPISSPAEWQITPTFVLPSAGGTVIVTVTGASPVNTAHTGRLISSAASDTKAWSGVGNFSLTFNLSSFGTSASFQALPTGGTERVKPDRVSWERQVSLSLGGKGAAFSISGPPGYYQLSNPPSSGSGSLHDVTNSLAPIVILLNGDQFQHQGGTRDYVMSGTGTLHTPQIVQNTPTNPIDKFNKRAVYIVPNSMGAGALPLRDYTSGRGYPAEVFSVEALYDWWSYGQVSPDAIRNFLRYAYQTWDVKPVAVTFVGDGTYDPLNYLGRIAVNPNHIPPYLAHVDPNVSTQPTLGETACDACYAQLDGDDPLSDWIPDLLFGRLPVHSLTELNALASKIIDYETAPFNAANLGWRARNVYLADNFLRPEAGGAPDPAGNFEQSSENSIAQQPSSLQIKRMYYDPYAAAPTDSKEPNATNAYKRTKALFNEGAGLVNFVGHANSIQLAVTDVSAVDPNPRYLLFLLDPDNMSNASKLPIVLQMSCLTSAFQVPIEYYGTTIDERLLLAHNGAIAVWGSSGQGVSYGHDALQRGFYKTLWSLSSPRMQTPIGLLAQGGYLELFAQSQGTGAAYELLRTFVLLGDPMTRARVGPASTYLPMVPK